MHPQNERGHWSMTSVVLPGEICYLGFLFSDIAAVTPVVSKIRLPFLHRIQGLALTFTFIKLPVDNFNIYINDPLPMLTSFIH